MMGWVGSGHTKWTHGQLCDASAIKDRSDDSDCLGRRNSRYIHGFDCDLATIRWHHFGLATYHRQYLGESGNEDAERNDKFPHEHEHRVSLQFTNAQQLTTTITIATVMVAKVRIAAAWRPYCDASIVHVYCVKCPHEVPNPIGGSGPLHIVPWVHANLSTIGPLVSK